MSEDDPVWQALLAGDKEACSQIYDKYARQMYLFGLRFTPNRELVEDAIHDVFVKIYNNDRLLGKVQNVKVYLFVALKNTLLNSLKKPATFQLDSHDSASTDGDFDAQTGMIEQERYNRFSKFISQLDRILSNRQRQVVYCRFVEEMSLAEIAQIMEISLQSVKNTLQLSIKKIRDVFPEIPIF